MKITFLGGVPTVGIPPFNGKLTEEKVEFIKYHNQEASITLLHLDKTTTEFGK